MPKKCLQCQEVYSLRRPCCPRCQSSDALVIGSPLQRGGRSLPGWALLLQGGLLAGCAHPESCLPVLALGGLLLAGIDQVVAWARLTALALVIGGPIVALAGHGLVPALLAFFGLILLWLLDEQRHPRLAVACIVLTLYYAVFASIAVVLPRL